MTVPPSSYIVLRLFQPLNMRRNTSLLTDEGFTDDESQMGSVQDCEGEYQFTTFLTVVQIS